MAREKSEKSTTEARPEHAEVIKPMPFPGESPTVSLALAAGQMYGLHEADEKPTRSSPGRRASATKKKPARSAAKAKKPARAAKAKKPARAGKAKAAAKAKRAR